MRLLSVAFAALVLVPASVLGWLGFRFSASLEERARAAVARETEDAVAALRAAAVAATEAYDRRLEDAAGAAAREVALRLPFEPAGAVLERARATAGAVVRIRDASGAVVLPAGPAPPPHGPWDETFERAARLEFRAGRPETAAAVLDALAPSVPVAWRARAWAAAGVVRRRHGLAGADRAVERLLRLPVAALLFPAAVELLARDPGGAAWLAAHRARLWEVPATPVARRRWGLDEPDAATLWVRRSAPLPAGARLEVAVAPDPARVLPARAGGFRVTYDPADADDRGVARLDLLGRAVRARVVNPAWDDLERSTRVRRTWTMVGIAALLGLMGLGLFLVQRALARERAARRLRDEFIANVSHELKTPLTSVRMYAEMMTEEGLSDAKRRQYGAVAEAEGARLASLVEDLLDFAALERGTRRLEPEPVDLEATLRATAAAWRPAAERDGVTLETGNGTAVAALADPTALGRILTNLVQNALKHGRPARVRLHAGPGPRIEVCDDGAGLAPAEEETIFERFRQGAGAVAGAGLGLSLSRELARAMHGDLTVERRRNETVFVVTLPPAPEVRP